MSSEKEKEVMKIYEIVSTLEHNANEVCEKYVQNAQLHRDGYVQACKDFTKAIEKNMSD